MAGFVLAITGTPACGKTTVSRRLSEETGAKVICLNELVQEGGLESVYDSVRETKLVDVEVLREHVSNIVGDGDTILDGLLSHLLPATHILVLRCDPRVLEQRMTERKYSRAKIMENLEAEYVGVLLYESLERCGNVMEADGTREVDLDGVEQWLRVGGKRIIELDWTREFKSVLESKKRFR